MNSTERPPPHRWWRRLARLGRHRILVADHVELSARAREFLHASIRRDRRRRGRSTAILSTLLVLAVLAAGFAYVQADVAYVQRGAAEERQRLATARLLLTRAEATLSSDPRTALQLDVAAHHVHPAPETEAGLAHLLLNSRFTGSLEGHIGAVRSVTFAPDGHTLATASWDQAVLLWDVSDPARARRHGDPLTGHTGPVSSGTFTPDGHTLATAGEDGTVLLWDVADPARPRRIGDPLTGHTGPVISVAFAPDGNTLATASYDSTMLWDLTGLTDFRNHPMERACTITRGGLDPDQWARNVPGLLYEDSCAT